MRRNKIKGVEVSIIVVLGDVVVADVHLQSAAQQSQQPLLTRTHPLSFKKIQPQLKVIVKTRNWVPE
jgi:type VI protein secretion system component Hcp